MKNMEMNVEKAESQLTQLHQNHLSVSQKLVEMQKKHRNFLKSKWESTMEKIRVKYTRQKERITAKFKQHYKKLDDQVLLLQEEDEEIMNNISF